jgi:hypothetical protein
MNVNVSNDRRFHFSLKRLLIALALVAIAILLSPLLIALCIWLTFANDWWQDGVMRLSDRPWRRSKKDA